jgi:hypothetical protein
MLTWSFTAGTPGRRRVPVGGWPTTIAMVVVSLAFGALLLWPLPTLQECEQVSGRVAQVYSDSVFANRRKHDRLHFRLEGREHTFAYEDTEPMYAEVVAQMKMGSTAHLWFKSPPTFIFPLYGTELWRIVVGDRIVVDYETIAADASRKKNGIALTGLFFFGLGTVAMLRATVSAVRAKA